MEPMSSETSDIKTQTPGNYPKEHITILINCSHSLIEKSYTWDEPMKWFLRQLLLSSSSSSSSSSHYKNIFQASFVITWDAQLCHILHFMIRLYPILQDVHLSFRNNQMCSVKGIGTNTQDLASLRTLSSAASAVKQWLCIDRLNSFNLLQISARYASSCNQGTSDKYQRGTPVAATKEHLTNTSPMMFLFQTKKNGNFFSQLKHCPHIWYSCCVRASKKY